MAVNPDRYFDDEPDENKGPPLPPLEPDHRKFARIARSALRLDKRTQREIDVEKAHRIANEFSWDKFEALTVTENGEGTYTVIEGQHRFKAIEIRDIGTHHDTLIPCLFVAVPEPPKQAQLALDITKGRMSHDAYAQWNLRLVAKHEHELMATAILQARGLRLGRSPSSHSIGAVATVRSIVHGGGFNAMYGSELLAQTVDSIMGAFPDYDPESNTSRWERPMLLGVATLIHKNPDLDEGRLVRSLRIRTAGQWVKLDRDHREPAYQAVLDNLGQLYNRGLRKGRLSW